MSRISFLVCSGLLVGCVSLDEIYLHDPELATIAAEAETTFADAASHELWQTIARNVEASVAAEQAAVAKSSEQRFEGKLQNIENLNWQKLQDCGLGLCWTVDGAAKFGTDLSDVDADRLYYRSTEEKISFLTGRVKQLTGEIEMLRTNIAEHVPVSETANLVITSSVSNAIAKVEARISELEKGFTQVRRQTLDRLESELDSVLEPIMDPFPRQRNAIKSKVDEALTDIRGKLETVTNLRALPREAADHIIKEASNAIPDDFPDQAKSALRAKLNAVFQFEDANKELNSLLKDLKSAVVVADNELDRVEELFASALGGSTSLSTRLHAVTDLLRKSEHLDLVNLTSVKNMFTEPGSALSKILGDKISIAEKFDKLKEYEISKEFADAFAETAQRPLCGGVSRCQVKHVLDYLSTDESKLQSIRTALRDDFRRATISAYNYELGTLQRELALMKELVAVVAQQHVTQMTFGNNVDRHLSANKINDLSITVYHDLDCLARSAGKTHGTTCAADTKTARDRFTNTLLILSRYFSLEGDLREQEVGLWLEVGHMKHLRSIEASRIAAMAHEQFIASGLQGLTAFTQGGITTEQIASVLRLLNTTLLTVIAREQ